MHSDPSIGFAENGIRGSHKCDPGIILTWLVELSQQNLETEAVSPHFLDNLSPNDILPPARSSAKAIYNSI